MSDLFEILHENDDLLVINKTAGLVCHPTKGDERSSLAGRVRLYLGADRPVHFINRLDRETSGVVFVAKTSDAARELRKLWLGREVAKGYWAIVHGHVREDAGFVDAPLGPDESSEIAVKDCVRPDGAAAQTRFRADWRFTREEGDFTWLRVEPVTGRKHQIRIHLQHLGHPIVGDKLYGLDESWYLKFARDELANDDWGRLILKNQALHAREVRFHWRTQDWLFEAEPKDEFCDFIETFEEAEANSSEV
ncbi:MAG: RNA pseudouridine synthase [Verrucomicrobiales bacterium]|nr:RNA pseudouridine synthase [Verrucomicrobiales bacterium]